jgi:hypothetical protein
MTPIIPRVTPPARYVTHDTARAEMTAWRSRNPVMRPLTWAPPDLRKRGQQARESRSIVTGSPAYADEGPF